MRARALKRGRGAARWATAVLLFVVSAQAWAGGPYGLPVCQAIADDFTADPTIRQAQLAHCDKVEEALVEWIYRAASRGIGEREAYYFAMLYIAPAHWQMLVDIDFSASCGNGSCDEGETSDICPEDCDGNAGGPGGPGGPGGGQPGGGAPGGGL